MHGDAPGRVIWLEQKVRGLEARTRALELYMSGPGCQNSKYGQPLQALPEDEYVPAGATAHDVDYAGLENRLAALEKASKPGKKGPVGAAPGRAIDVTGLLIGSALIITGVLLYSGSMDLLKNPLLSLGCGILITAYALIRLFFR